MPEIESLVQELTLNLIGTDDELRGARLRMQYLELAAYNVMNASRVERDLLNN